jgi:hypothetical protein
MNGKGVVRGLVALGCAAASLMSAGAAAADVSPGSSFSTTGTGSTVTLRNVAVGAGANRLLVVGVASNSNALITGVSWGGTALTSESAAAASGGGSNARSEVWTLVGPANATHDVTVTFAGSASAIVGAENYTGVDQLAPIPVGTQSQAYDSSNFSGTNYNNTVQADGMFATIAVGNTGNTSEPASGITTDLVQPTDLWKTTVGSAVHGTGSTRIGNTGRNRATVTGFGYHWGNVDSNNRNPHAEASISIAHATMSAIGPTVSGPTATAVTTSSATLGGNVTDDGGTPITERGVVYCTGACVNPTTATPGAVTVKDTSGGTTGTFTVPVSGLAPNTRYFFTAYAQNRAGTTFSVPGSFTTLRPNTAPTANAGGPYTIGEGTGLSLDGSGSNDPDGDALTYAWDLDGDGQYDDATGAKPTLTAAQAATLGMGDGPATHAIAVRVGDPSGATAIATANVTVTNKQPVPSGSGVPAHPVEGTPWTLHVSATDPSAADTAAGIRYEIDVDDDGTWDFGGDTYATATTQTDFTITPDDSGAQTVDVLAFDKDGASALTTVVYDVANVAPTATLSTGGAVDEGTKGTVSFGGQSDPSGADTAAGFHYAYDLDGDGRWDVGDGTYAGSPSTATADVPTTDDGTVTVRAMIIDKDDATNTYTKTLTVDDVAPDGTVANDGPVDEGSPAHVSVSGVTDPSSADTAAGFRYAYDIGDDGSWDSGDGSSYATATTASSVTVPTTDDGTTAVKVAILDKDGGVTTHVTDVVATGVAPTATLANDGPVDEGSDLHVAFTGAADPSSADTTAGFHYAYDTDGNGTWDIGDGTYAGSPGDATATVPTADSGNPRIRAAIIDKNGLSTIYTTVALVRNVAPVVAIAAPDSTPIDTNLLFPLTTTDASSEDAASTFTYTLNWGDGTAAERLNGPTGKVAVHAFTTAGTYTVTVTATDKDGGTSAPATVSVTIPPHPAPPATTTTPPVTTTPTSTPAPVTGASTPPVLAKVQSLSVSPRCVAAAAATSRSVRIRYRLSTTAAVRVTLQRSTGSHAVAKCPSPRGSQQDDGRYKPGSYAPVSVKQTTGSSGGTSLTIAKGSKGGAVGSVATVRPQALIAKGGKLAPGTYLLTVTTLSADGKVQDTARVKFWVLKAKATKKTKKG